MDPNSRPLRHHPHRRLRRREGGLALGAMTRYAFGSHRCSSFRDYSRLLQTEGLLPEVPYRRWAHQAVIRKPSRQMMWLVRE